MHFVSRVYHGMYGVARKEVEDRLHAEFVGAYAAARVVRGDVRGKHNVRQFEQRAFRRREPVYYIQPRAGDLSACQRVAQRFVID